MANSTCKPALVKQLKEHLQEQQEPFKLSTYLAERRYTMKCLSSRDGNGYCLTSPTENLKEPRSRVLNKSILQAPRILKCGLYKLITPKDRQELSTSNKAVKDKVISETIDLIQQIAETNWFSNVNNVTAFGASSDYGAPEVCPPTKHQNGSPEETYQALEAKRFEEHKTLTDTNKEGGCMDDDKQLNPVTELQDVTYHKGLSTRSLILTQAKGSPCSQAFLWRSLTKSMTGKRFNSSRFNRSKGDDSGWSSVPRKQKAHANATKQAAGVQLHIESHKKLRQKQQLQHQSLTQILQSRRA